MKLLPVIKYIWFLQLCVVVLPCGWCLPVIQQCISLLTVKLLAHGFVCSLLLNLVPLHTATNVPRYKRWTQIETRANSARRVYTHNVNNGMWDRMGGNMTKCGLCKIDMFNLVHPWAIAR